MRTKKHIKEDMVFVNHPPGRLDERCFHLLPSLSTSETVTTNSIATRATRTIRHSHRSYIKSKLSPSLPVVRLWQNKSNFILKPFFVMPMLMILSIYALDPHLVYGKEASVVSNSNDSILNSITQPTYNYSTIENFFNNITTNADITLPIKNLSHISSVITAKPHMFTSVHPYSKSITNSACRSGGVACHRGSCLKGACVCDSGWKGAGCDICTGRGRLEGRSGTVMDGFGNYSLDTTCTWLIKGPENTRIRLNFAHFATECSWDHLYVYDGDSAFSPLLGIFSGLINPSNPSHPEKQYAPELIASRNLLYLHFYSDAAYNMTGFTLNFRAENCDNGACCPRNCSGAGVCTSLGACACDDGLIGEACRIQTCNPGKPSRPSSGISPPFVHNGLLHTFDDSVCICNHTHRGPNCQVPVSNGLWQVLKPKSNAQKTPAVASFRTVLVDSLLYIVGGTSLNQVPHPPFLSVINLKNSDAPTWVMSGGPSGKGFEPSPRYGHSANLHNFHIYVFGGVVDSSVITADMWEFNLRNSSWSLVTGASNATFGSAPAPPLAVTGHAAVVVNNRLVVIFGHSPIYGYVNHVQEFHLETRTWTLPRVGGAFVKGGYGHTATYISSKQLIFVHGGLVSEKPTSAHLVDVLYEFDPFRRFWRILKSSGQPKYLHSMVFMNDLLLVFGGNTHKDTAMSHGAKCFSADFMAYDIECGEWHHLPAPSSLLSHDISRFGHAAEVYQDKDAVKMYVYGGFNGFMLRDLLVYYPAVCIQIGPKHHCLTTREGIRCVWAGKFGCRREDDAETLRQDKQVHASSIIGTQCSSDVVVPPGNPGADSGNPTVEGGGFKPKTPPPRKSDPSACLSSVDCASCMSSFGCIWCENTCRKENPDLDRLCHDRKNQVDHDHDRGTKNLTNVTTDDAHTKEPEICGGEERETTSQYCKHLHNCLACETELHCTWQSTGANKCVPKKAHEVKPLGGKDKKTMTTSHYNRCEPSCSSKTSCRNCTEGMCMWCDNIQRCVDSNAYVVSFPFGQCMAWANDKERCPVKQCSEIKTCDGCLKDPRCGWCDDGSRTGLGVCTEGGDNGPVKVHPSAIRGLIPGVHSRSDSWLGVGQMLDSNATDVCPRNRWHFTSCPKCQCHGHASCPLGSDDCGPCRDNTEGKHCEDCQDGFWGKPKLGNNCTACDCNHQAVTCDRNNGRCFCKTKGITGEKCEQCDSSSQYFGNPINSSCFYQLKPDYHYTFNLSRPDDIHYTQINFQNMPRKSRKDVDFQLNCSQECKFNITFRSLQTNEERLIISEMCQPDLFEKKFKASQYHFGEPHNTTFYVYVYGFRGGNKASPWFHVKISFQQNTMPFSLVNLFIIFFSCFLSLLLLGAIFWKIKQRYDTYRRRQRAYVEMEQMASRPFAMVFPDLTSTSTDDLSRQSPAQGAPTNGQKPVNLGIQRSKDSGCGVACPSPVALEPCADNKAAVLSLLIILPHGDDETAPPGTTGMLMGSTLVNLGTNRKASESKSHREGWNCRKGGGQCVLKDASTVRSTSNVLQHHPQGNAHPLPPNEDDLGLY